MPSIYFSAEHEDFRAKVRDFIDREVTPSLDVWERDRRLPGAFWRALGREGLLGLLHARSVGGADRDLFYSVVLLEELGRTGSGGLRAAVSVHAYMATQYLARGGADIQRTHLAPAVAGDAVAALAITEPGAGSDLAGIETAADPEGDRFVVHGVKSMVTNGTCADFYVLAARTDRTRSRAAGLSLLVVDADLPGITTARQEKIGWHCADTAEVRFDGVRVPADRVLGRPNGGFYELMRGFRLERLVAAVLALGGMDRCLADLLDHLRTRAAFRKSLADLQSLRHRTADLATQLEAARQLVYHAAWCHQSGEQSGEPSMAQPSMAKLFATELACLMADESLQMHGAAGYLAESAASRFYRDSRAATIAAGPSEVMRDIIARLLIDENNLRTPPHRSSR